MTNILTRIKNSISADINELLDEKEQKNPIATLNQYLRECEQEVLKVRNLVERQNRLKEEFYKELQEAKYLFGKRERQSEVAKAAGETDLYEYAIKEKLELEHRTESLERSYENALMQLKELEEKYQDMNAKLKDMKMRRMELMGKENYVRANRRMDRMMDDQQMFKSLDRFSEMEYYIEGLGRQMNEKYDQHQNDIRLEQLEKKMEQVEK
ncbi:PspA/IM30 family protein [Bacillus carboniphilus]|uniref:PspA/IM30 family protein n=1 Tax=Bacillus carboniphilus TaxID=86663 RepID=A0ABY9JUP1_9BACI|nr:PspA/IM30 family protein [Bacillus carboniphilus]WLR42458.1 PspA/IM30 family protein [Bacillus carboniphilus]